MEVAQQQYYNLAGSEEKQHSTSRGYEVPLEIQSHRYEVIEEERNHIGTEMQDVPTKKGTSKHILYGKIEIIVLLLLALIVIFFFVGHHANHVQPPSQERHNFTKLVEDIFLLNEELKMTTFNLTNLHYSYVELVGKLKNYDVLSGEMKSKYNLILTKYYELQRQDSIIYSQVKNMNDRIVDQNASAENQANYNEILEKYYELQKQNLQLMSNIERVNNSIASQKRMNKELLFENNRLNVTISNIPTRYPELNRPNSPIRPKHFVSNERMKYRDCVEFCKSINSEIATSIIRNHTLLRNLQKNGVLAQHFAWIGLKRVPGTYSYVYSDGIASTSSNTPWKKGQPNKYRVQNCVVLSSGDYKVIDVSCEYKMCCLCQQYQIYNPSL